VRDTLAIVTARGGSKGLPGKHLRELGGKPILAWSIEAGLASARVTRVLVTSDDPAILACARAQGAETLLRPEELARDDTPTMPVLLHALRALSPAEPCTLLLQPTSPLRTAQDVDGALALRESLQADAVISVTEPAHSPWKAFYVTPEGTLRGIVSEDAPFQPRQSFPRAAQPNGAIYACPTAQLLTRERLFGPRTVPFFMEEARSVDIDTEEDLRRAEAWLRARAGGA
jgi:CMP-N-acetylneuraminic acid synthetase